MKPVITTEARLRRLIREEIEADREKQAEILNAKLGMTVAHLVGRSPSPRGSLGTI